MARPRQRMGCWKRCKTICFLVVLVASTISVCQPKGTKHQVDKFFCSVDRDGDGEIERHEATKFLSELDASLKEDDANLFEQTPEFSYGGKTICSKEMKDRLQNMLTADMVVNWIIHGLQLPQYAEAFQKNAINGLDFPSLIDSSALTDELGVSSSLHRTKITNAIVRQIFGFGRPPGTPLQLTCRPSTCGGIQLNWETPSDLGYPPLHKYLVFRWSGATSKWVIVADTKETSFFDNDKQLYLRKPYSYRIQAWGGHGPSDWVTITNCTASPRSISFNLISKKTEEHVLESHKEEVKHVESTAWAWICSVNGGLFLLGILSRQSFFFRVTLAAWVVIRRFFKRVCLKIYAGQSSDKIWLRILARFFVSVCRGWISIQRKILVLSRQAGPCKTVEDEKHAFRDAIGYSIPDCTFEDMLAAIEQAKFEDKKHLDVAGRVTGFMNDVSNSSSKLETVDDQRSSSEGSNSLRSLSSPERTDERTSFIIRKRSRHRCNHEGCKNRFDRWYNYSDWRMRFSKHYCRECQRVFCVKHTRISPHGAVGRCGLDSTCVCITCFGSLSLEIQERLEKINKLRVGPPVFTDSSSTSSSSYADRDPFPPDFGSKKP